MKIDYIVSNKMKCKGTIKKKIGNTCAEYPIDDPWAPTKKVIGTFPDDFMEDRNQPLIDLIAPNEIF